MLPTEIYNSMKPSKFFTIYLHGEGKEGSAHNGGIIRNNHAAAQMFRDEENRLVVEIRDCKLAGIDDQTVNALTSVHPANPELRLV